MNVNHMLLHKIHIYSFQGVAKAVVYNVFGVIVRVDFWKVMTYMIDPIICLTLMYLYESLFIFVGSMLEESLS